MIKMDIFRKFPRTFLPAKGILYSLPVLTGVIANRYGYKIPLILLPFIFLGCSQKPSLVWIPFNWESDTISGKYVEKAYLYVPVNIEDLPHDFTMQLDLGTYPSSFYGNSIDVYLEEYPSLAENLDSTGMFHNVNLQMGAVEFKGIDVLYYKGFGEEIPKDSLHSKTPKHIGTITYDMFRDKFLVIDYKSCRFAVSDGLPAEYADLPTEEFELVGGIMKLPFRINGEDCKLMFDTGSSPFQLVTTKERALEISDSVIVDSLSGPLWWGQEMTINGLEVNKPVEFGGRVLEDSRVYYVEDELWDGIYKNLDVWGIAGNAYFFDNIVVIDYKNKLFRIK